MGIEAQKQDIIQRLKNVTKEEVLNKYEQLLNEAEFFTRANESVKSIENGETISLDDFSKGNKGWLRSKSIG